MKRSAFPLLLVLLVGCQATPAPERGIGVPLDVLEGRILGMTKLDWNSKYKISHAIEIHRPKDYRGMNAWIRFKDSKDRGSRLIMGADGLLVRVQARKGRGIFTSDGIILVSESDPVVTLMEEEPNQTPEPTRVNARHADEALGPRGSS